MLHCKRKSLLFADPLQRRCSGLSAIVEKADVDMKCYEKFTWINKLDTVESHTIRLCIIKRMKKRSRRTHCTLKFPLYCENI